VLGIIERNVSVCICPMYRLNKMNASGDLAVTELYSPKIFNFKYDEGK
jgi:hypothetical protein